MIQQAYEQLYPEPVKPTPLTLDEQKQLVRAAQRLMRAVRQYLYEHGAYGTHGTPGGFDKKHDYKTCKVCAELQAALDDA